MAIENLVRIYKEEKRKYFWVMSEWVNPTKALLELLNSRIQKRIRLVDFKELFVSSFNCNRKYGITFCFGSLLFY